ncbi:MAG: hypothetical protein D3924_03310 [Candidatus Electrothrix sp. AR4]|nr:hypothetical protein [Candidatus Electrothrix sp. AR4]
MASWIVLLTNAIRKRNPEFAAGFQEWLWQPGMRFQDDRLWWGASKRRVEPHEGVDLACYTNQQGRSYRLVPGLRIPALFAGRVAQLHQDFLAWSLYLRHDQFTRDKAVLHTVYGHVRPKRQDALNCLGEEVAVGETVALLAEYSRSHIPLHLHFTAAWIPNSIAPHRFDWRLLSEHRQVVLLDPSGESNLCERKVVNPSLCSPGTRRT